MGEDDRTASLCGKRPAQEIDLTVGEAFGIGKSPGGGKSSGEQGEAASFEASPLGQKVPPGIEKDETKVPNSEAEVLRGTDCREEVIQRRVSGSLDRS